MRLADGRWMRWHAEKPGPVEVVVDSGTALPVDSLFELGYIASPDHVDTLKVRSTLETRVTFVTSWRLQP